MGPAMRRRALVAACTIFILVSLCGGVAEASSPSTSPPPKALTNGLGQQQQQVADLSQPQQRQLTQTQQPSSSGGGNANADANSDDSPASDPSNVYAAAAAVTAATAAAAPSSSSSLTLPTSIGESALVDHESGRIFWQGGPSVLFLSSGSVLERAGIKHLRATALTTVLLLAALSALAAWTRDKLVPPSSSSLDTPVIDPTGGHWRTALIFLARCTVLLPRFKPWFVILTAVLYVIEAHSCSTRRYLANALRGPAAVESYIEGLRQSPPIATWTVRCFHYERRKSLAWLGFLLDLWLGTTGTSNGGQSMEGGGEQGQRDDTAVGANGDAEPSATEILRTASFLTKKVITHRATKRYDCASWGDQTTVGLWKRAWSADLTAPFTKLTLSKVLLLADAKARADYFTQQSTFVMTEGQKDQYAEFSTNIQVEGFKPKVLAVRPLPGSPSPKIFRLHLFWIFTSLGLTVPYRIWFARHCDELCVTIVKETFAVDKKKRMKKSRWFSLSGSSSGVSNNLAATNSGSGGTEAAGSDFRRRMQQVAIYEKDAESSIVERDTAQTVVGMQKAISESVNETGAATSDGTTKGVPRGSVTSVTTTESPSLQSDGRDEIVTNYAESTEKKKELGPVPLENGKGSKQMSEKR